MKLNNFIKTLFDLLNLTHHLDKALDFDVVFMLDDYAIPINKISLNFEERRIEINE